jgi:hypothetical protein
MLAQCVVDCIWNVMAHAQKPDFVFQRNGQAHLNRWGRQFGRLLAAEVCASAVVMLDTPCSEVAWRVLLPTPFASFPFTTPPLRHRVPSYFNRTLLLTCGFRTVSYYCHLWLASVGLASSFYWNATIKYKRFVWKVWCAVRPLQEHDYRNSGRISMLNVGEKLANEYYPCRFKILCH